MVVQHAAALVILRRTAAVGFPPWPLTFLSPGRGQAANAGDRMTTIRGERLHEDRAAVEGVTTGPGSLAPWWIQGILSVDLLCKYWLHHISHT